MSLGPLVSPWPLLDVVMSRDHVRSLACSLPFPESGLGGLRLSPYDPPSPPILGGEGGLTQPPWE